MNNGSDEKRSADKAKQLEEAMIDRDRSLVIAIVCAIAMIVAFIIGKHPETADETIREMAEMIWHFKPLVAGLCVVNIGLYFAFRKDVVKLTRDIQADEENQKEADKDPEADH